MFCAYHSVSNTALINLHPVEIMFIFIYYTVPSIFEVNLPFEKAFVFQKASAQCFNCISLLYPPDRVYFWLCLVLHEGSDRHADYVLTMQTALVAYRNKVKGFHVYPCQHS